MDTEKIAQLKGAGINVDEALERFMGNEALLERFLKKFLMDDNFQKLESAIAEHDQEAAVSASHTLKGMCGNLSMTLLFDLLARQVAALRAGEWKEASELMDEISERYGRAADAIGCL